MDVYCLGKILERNGGHNFTESIIAEGEVRETCGGRGGGMHVCICDGAHDVLGPALVPITDPYDVLGPALVPITDPYDVLGPKSSQLPNQLGLWPEWALSPPRWQAQVQQLVGQVVATLEDTIGHANTNKAVIKVWRYVCSLVLCVLSCSTCAL